MIYSTRRSNILTSRPSSLCVMPSVHSLEFNPIQPILTRIMRVNLGTPAQDGHISKSDLGNLRRKVPRSGRFTSSTWSHSAKGYIYKLGLVWLPRRIQQCFVWWWPLLKVWSLLTSRDVLWLIWPYRVSKFSIYVPRPPPTALRFFLALSYAGTLRGPPWSDRWSLTDFLLSCFHLYSCTATTLKTKIEFLASWKRTLSLASIVHWCSTIVANNVCASCYL